MGRAAGLTRGHYNRIENGVKKPTAVSVERISRALEAFGVKADTMWIIFGSGRAASKIRKRKPAKEATS